MFTRFANPQRFMQISAALTPATAALALLFLAVGLPWALVFSPADYLQGESVRIMYIHVPAAMLSLGIYVGMGAASLISLVWRHALADVAAKVSAPIGFAFAGICLATGSLWGQPTWGTWWIWDARLTSMLILFLTYGGYLALWAAIEDETRAARLASILCLAGLINIPIVKFSVDWWNTLHQPASLFRAGGPTIDSGMLLPLSMMILGFGFAYLALLLAGMRAEIYRRRATALVRARSLTA